MVSLRCFVVVLAVAASSATDVTPVQKVLTMMNEMKSKGEKMMDEEAKTFAAYSEWVSDTSRELGFEIEKGKSDSDKFSAAADKADSDAAGLGRAIEKLNEELSRTEGEKAEATEIRNGQHAEYVKISTDYSESVDALERAIQTMQSRNYDVPEQAALLQKMSVEKPGMRPVLAAFLQETQKQ